MAVVRTSYDLAVIGSGFGGTLLAMCAQRAGRSVVLLERAAHPRFAMGESSTPLANLLLEELAQRYGLPRVAALAKWGTWQREHPKVACGLKRGFTFLHHTLDKPFAADAERRDQLLVAASPRDDVADTHWYRADFDHLLVREAQAQGVDVLEQAKLTGVRFDDAQNTISGEQDGKKFFLRVGFVVDASGPGGFLHRALNLPTGTFRHLPQTQALYSHFTGVRRLDEMKIFPASEPPPYPVDDAAVHHVFDGGWIWVLRFNNGITSAGVAATDRVAKQFAFSDVAVAWERLLKKLPTVRAQFADAKPTMPFVYAPRLNFRSGIIHGGGWALLPSAAGFVDPLLSTGFPLTLMGVARLAQIIGEDLGTPRLAAGLDEYARQTAAELYTTEHLVAALYANMRDFEVFAALSLLYFAAASFSETVRRLGQPERARSFLLADDPKFGPRLHACCARALRPMKEPERAALLRDIAQTLEPLNVTGLARSERRNWYPASAEDLLAAAPKLGVERAAIEALLLRCGFAAA